MKRKLFKKYKKFGRIQKRILSTTVAFCLGMCLFICIPGFFVYNHFLQRNLISSAQSNLLLVSDSINSSISDVLRMARFCQTNPNIAEYIENNPNPGSVLSVQTYDRLTEEFSANSSSMYIPRLVIFTNSHFLQICVSSISTTRDLSKDIPKQNFFDSLMYSSGYDFTYGLIKDPFYRGEKYVIPVICPITYQFSSTQGGYLYMEVASELFTVPIGKYALSENSYVYISLGDHIYRYDHGSLKASNGDYEVVSTLKNNDPSSKASITKVRFDRETTYMISYPLAVKDCYIYQSISKDEIASQVIVFWLTLFAVFVGIFTIGIIMSLVLNKTINEPVQKIREKISRISEGDFERDSSIEWNHELGDIGKGINALSTAVTNLMETRLEDEKKKQDLEYRMLLSQINPHFIYNTLNSIKWMAQIQGADGISEMTVALSRLLKSISKGTKLLVSIEEELSLVKDYFTIQNYRYGGAISFNILITDPEILSSQIVKFTLQPLVENAIFHGIEPKGGHGTITIDASTSVNEEGNKDICVLITDDGVGMSQEKISEVLKNNADAPSEFFKEVGISNVNRRIMHEYGPDYGISIYSVIGEGTTMSVRFPERKASGTQA